MAFEKAAACKIQTAASTSYLAFLKCPLQRVQFIFGRELFSVILLEF